MFATQHKKNKIDLLDYPFQRELDSRLLLANLNEFEINLLREILNNSLSFQINSFATQLGTALPHVISFFEKIKPLNLLKVNKDLVTVDKEARKYYEQLLVKFDEDFEAGFDTLFTQLSRIPTTALISWYGISRNSDDLFQTILDKFLATPKVFQRYLQDVQFDEPRLKEVITMVFSAPDFIVPSQMIMQRFNLSHRDFHQWMLLLEFNLICTLKYRKTAEGWEEVAAPYFEWHEYLRFQRDTTPKVIKNTKEIERDHTEDFGFVQDMSKMLTYLNSKPIPVEEAAQKYFSKGKEATKLFVEKSEEYLSRIIQALVLHGLAVVDKLHLFPTENGLAWLLKNDQDKALTLSRHPIQVERDLKRVNNAGWVYVDDFLKGFTGSLGFKENAALKRKGKKWKYCLPSYTQEEMTLIEKTLCERLFEAGIVATGIHNGKACFCVTPFGKMILEE